MLNHIQNTLFRSDAKLWPTMVVWQNNPMQVPSGGDALKRHIETTEQEAGRIIADLTKERDELAQKTERTSWQNVRLHNLHRVLTRWAEEQDDIKVAWKASGSQVLDQTIQARKGFIFELQALHRQKPREIFSFTPSATTGQQPVEPAPAATQTEAPPVQEATLQTRYVRVRRLHIRHVSNNTVSDPVGTLTQNTEVSVQIPLDLQTAPQREIGGRQYHFVQIFDGDTPTEKWVAAEWLKDGKAGGGTTTTTATPAATLSPTPPPVASSSAATSAAAKIKTPEKKKAPTSAANARAANAKKDEVVQRLRNNGALGVVVAQGSDGTYTIAYEKKAGEYYKIDIGANGVVASYTSGDGEVSDQDQYNTLYSYDNPANTGVQFFFPTNPDAQTVSDKRFKLSQALTAVQSMPGVANVRFDHGTGAILGEAGGVKFKIWVDKDNNIGIGSGEDGTQDPISNFSANDNVHTAYVACLMDKKPVTNLIQLHRVATAIGQGSWAYNYAQHGNCEAIMKSSKQTEFLVGSNMNRTLWIADKDGGGLAKDAGGKPQDNLTQNQAITFLNAH